MNFIYRIGVGLIACSAVACSKNDADNVVPIAEPETVIIGCSGAVGADIDVRTQLADDLSVRWVSGDEIRLWAREADVADFLTDVRNVPFRFDYYSPSWSRAGFKGTIGGVGSTFDTTKKYDYFAVSPAPASDADVDGTRVTYTIPAVQTGEFNSGCDIMTAQLPAAAALLAGDNNPSINLVFHHHIHLLRFTIPTNALGEPVRAVELTFPSAVVGPLTVDATGATADDFSALDDRTVKIEFPKGQEKDAGSMFYAMIAPVSFGSDAKIEMRIIGTTGETSADVPVADKTFAAERSTLVKLNVPAKNTFYTVLKFCVADNTRDDLKSQPNLLGENTLGERVDTVRLKGGACAFSNAVRMTAGCSVSDDGSVLTCVVPDDPAFDGVYELSFVSRKDAGSKCPYEAWDSSVISGRKLEVEYESASAWIRSIADYSTVQTETLPTIDPARTEPYELGTLSIPYLFEEDFSKANGLDIHGTDNKKEQDGSNLDNRYFLYGGWTGNQVAGYTGYFEIKTRVEATLAISGLYNGRLDSAPMRYWKNDSNKRLQVQFDYYHHAGSSAAYTRKMNYGTTETPEAINAYWYGMDGWKPGEGGNKVSGKSCPLEVDKDGKIDNKTWIIENATNATRLSWELEVTGKPETGSHNHLLRLSNLKVSIIE